MNDHLCQGTEAHPHFSLATQTFVEHEHEHEPIVHEFNRLHHHAPEEHHLFQMDELMNKHRDTGRKLQDVN